MQCNSCSKVDMPEQVSSARLMSTRAWLLGKAPYVFVLVQASEGAYGRWLAADVVCHELAHQWFGNYVTCQDFDNIAGRVTALSYLHDRVL